MDRTWTGGAGTTVINTAGNWSGGAAPSAADTGIWDGTVQTNEPYIWNASTAGSGQTAPSWVVQGAYTNAIRLDCTNGSATATLLSMSNLTINAGAGPFSLGNGEDSTAGTVWRGATNGVSGVTFPAGVNLYNQLINNSTNAATIGSEVAFNSGGGSGTRLVSWRGSGNWIVNAPLRLAGSGGLAIAVNGTGANTLALNAANSGNMPGSIYINSGTLQLASGDALNTGGSQTITIDGGGGIRRLALTNNITLNAAMANINIAGRNATSGVAEAALYNISGDNAISGIVRFNAPGGTNVILHNAAGTLTMNGNMTAGTVTGDRFFRFEGSGTNIVNGIITNGSANLGVAVESGMLVLNNANIHTGNTILNGGVLTVGNNQALQSSTVVVNGGVLDLNGGNGYSPSIAGLSGPGVVDTLSGGTPTLSVGNNNVTSTFNGNLTNSSGTVSLQKIGAGTFTLAGASGFSGGTTVAQGTLLAGNTVGSATGSGTVTVQSGAAFGGNGSVAGNVDWQSGSLGAFVVTPTTAVSGSNSTVLTVSGSITLNGNAVTINVPGAPLVPGTYKLMNYTVAGSSGSFASAPVYTGSGAELGTSSSVTTSGGQVVLTVTFTGVVSTWINDADQNWTTGANWSSSPYYPQVAGDTATLGVSSAFRTVNLGSPVSVGTIIFTNANSFKVADAGGSLTIAGPAGGLISVQAGSSNAIAPALTLNTNLSVTMVANSALALEKPIANGSGTFVLNLSGPGTVALSGNNTYGPAAGTVGTTVSGGVVQLGHNNALGAGDVSVSGGTTLRAAAPLALANNVIANAATTLDNNGNAVTVAGVISGTGSFTKDGAGTLTLNSVGTYAGNTTVNNGLLKLGVAGAVPGGTGFGNVTVNTNATLDLNGTSATFNGLNGAGTVDSSVGGSLTLTLGESGAGGTFSGSLKNTAGTLSLVKNGAGTQTLGGTNSYTGSTTINEGTLQIGNGGTTGNLGAGALLNNGNLQFNLTGTNVFAASISGTGTVALANTALDLWLTGNNTFTGNVSVNGGNLWVTNPASLGVGPKTVFVVGGGVSAATALRLAGNVTIDSSIDYRMSYLNGACFNESGTNTLAGNIGLTFGGGAAYIVSKSGLLTLSGTIYGIDSGRTLRLGGAGDGVVSGVISQSFGPNGLAAVEKVDAGTWKLTADNDYNGNTTVNGGTLIMSGNNTGSGTYTVNSGGTLIVDGNNYGAGAVSVATNGTLGGIGSIYSATTFQTGAKGKFTTSASLATPLTVYGNVVLNNNSIEVHVAGGTPLPAGTYPLLIEGNTILYTITGSFSPTPVITGAGLQAGTIASVVSSGLQVVLTVANTSTWTSGVNGNWTTGANWSSNPQYPDEAGEFANFGVGAGFITVNLNASQTVGGVNFTNENSFAITNAGNTLTLNNIGSGASINVTAGLSNAIATRVSLAEPTVVATAPGTALLLPGPVEGFSGVTFAGNGLVRLSGSNTYSGDTVLSGGTLALGSTNAVSSGTLTISGGQLDSVVPNLVNANNNPQNWNGSFAFLGSQSLDLGNGAVNAGTTEKTLTVSSNTLTVRGTVSGTGRIIKAGNGALVLLAANGGSHTGGLRIDAGTVVIGDDAALGSGTVEFASATATIQSSDATARTVANSMNLSFGGIYAGTGDLTFTGPLASGNFGKTIVVSNATTTFSGVLAGGTGQNAPNTKAGPGTLILSGDNSALPKKFAVNEGTLALGSATAIGTGELTLSGGGLDSRVVDLVNAGNNPQVWSGSFYFAGTENLHLGTGPVTLGANVTVTVSNKTLTVGGPASGAAYSLTKAGAGTLVLNGTNNYANTTVAGGTLALAQATLATNSTVSVATNAVLQLNFGTTNTVAALVLNGTPQPAGVYGNTTPGGYIAGPGALKVVPLGPTGPGYLTNSIAGNLLSLSWPSGQGWRLQVQTNSRSVGLSTNWFYVTDGNASSTNITVNPADPTVFYRLMYP